MCDPHNYPPDASTSAAGRRVFAIADLLLAARTNFHSAWWSFCKCRIKALVPLWVYRGHSMPSSRPREHLTFLPWFGPEGTAGENLVK